MVGMGCSYTMRFATLLLLLLVTLAIAIHSHLTRIRTLDETTSPRRNSEFEEDMGDPREGLSDIMNSAMEGSEGKSEVELIKDLTTNFLEEAKALGESELFLEQLEQFRCPVTPALNLT